MSENLPAGVYESHEDAFHFYLFVRAMSLAVSLGVGIGLAVVLPPEPIVIAVVTFSLFLAFVFVAMTPVGDYLSMFTAWAGWMVESCPYCPLFHFTPLHLISETCDHCGGTVFAAVAGRQVPGWIYSGSNRQDSYCSYDCADQTGASQ